MTLTDHIAAVRDSKVMQPGARRARIASLKAEAVQAALPETSKADPTVIQWESGGRGFAVVIESIERDGGAVRCRLDIVRDGVLLDWDRDCEWVIVNPPTLVADPDGDIVQPILRPGMETREAAQVGERRFREDPEAAFCEALRDFAESRP